MSEIETSLLSFLKKHSVKFGRFELASGAISDHYVDCKMTMLHPEGAWLIGEAIYARTESLGIEAIGGLETGAIPLTISALVSFHTHGRADVSGFWVRDKVKDHGTKKLIEGGLEPGKKVLIVEDVTTKGGSALKAVEAIREHGCEIAMVLSLVDRQAGAGELFASHGIELHSLFTLPQLLQD